MAYKSRKERKHRAHGGKAGEGVLRDSEIHHYNAVGSPEGIEAENEKEDGFKRGGHMEHKRAHGGHVDGHKGKHHLGKRARGGRMEHEKKEHEKEEHRARGGHIGHHKHAGKGGHHAVHHGHGMARGGSPLSAAHHVSPPGTTRGSPGEQAPVSD